MAIDVRDAKNTVLLEVLGDPGWLKDLTDLNETCEEVITLVEQSSLTKIDISIKLVRLLSPESEKMKNFDRLLEVLYEVASHGQLTRRAERVKESGFGTAAIAVAPRKTRQEVEQLREALATVLGGLRQIHNAALLNCGASTLNELNGLRARTAEINSGLQAAARAVALD